MDVIKGVVACLALALQWPAGEQGCAALRDIHAEQVQTPQHRGCVDAVQTDLHLLGRQVAVDHPQGARRVQAFNTEQGLVPPQVGGEAIALGPGRLVLA